MDNKDMPASPVSFERWQELFNAYPYGLTKREELAARVLPEIYREYFAGARNGEYGIDPEWPQGIAHDAFRVADAFFEMAEQDKENTDD